MGKQFDVAAFEYINGLAGKSAVFDAIGIFFAEYFQYALGAVLVLAVIFGKEQGKKTEWRWLRQYRPSLHVLA